MSQSQWYYLVNGEQMGPISSEQLKQLATDGKVTQDTHVWREGLDDWKPARLVQGLFDGGAAAGAMGGGQTASSPSEGTVYTGALGGTGAGGMNQASGDLNLAVEPLVQTRPWVKLFAVLIFLGCAFMALAGCIAPIGGLAGGQPVMIFVGVLYLAFAVLYFFIGKMLWSYGSAITMFEQRPVIENLVQALAHQKTFWKTVGIIALIMIALQIVVLFFVIIGGFLRMV